MNRTLKGILCLAGTALSLWGQANAPAQAPPETATFTSPAGVRHLTLSEAVALALENNRNIQLAGAAVSRAAAEQKELGSLFRPQILAGTGLAATRGFPLSIEGSAPSIFQLSSSQSLFDPSLRNLEKQAGKMRDAAASSLEEKRDEVVAATALAYLDLDRSRRALEYVRNQTKSLAGAAHIVGERVREGLDPTLESTRAELEAARGRSQEVALENQAALLEFQLRDLLGIAEPVGIETEAAEIPLSWPDDNVDRAVALAWEKNSGLTALEEEIRAKEFQVRSEEATRWPRVNLVGQYGLFSDINNFSDYFRKFSRHNATFGISVVVPVYERERYAARLSKAEAELAESRYRLEETRATSASPVRELWGQTQQQAAAREVARLELDFARKSLDATLALYEEGRVSQLAVEQARAEETRSQVSLLEAEYQASRTRLALLRITGQVRSVLR